MLRPFARSLKQRIGKKHCSNILVTEPVYNNYLIRWYYEN